MVESQLKDRLEFLAFAIIRYPHPVELALEPSSGASNRTLTSRT
jgi:hypothetical protein